MKLTKEQGRALKRVYERTVTGKSFLTFRRSVQVAFGNVAMVEWCGMILGIEPDGYTHS